MGSRPSCAAPGTVPVPAMVVEFLMLEQASGPGSGSQASVSIPDNSDELSQHRIEDVDKVDGEGERVETGEMCGAVAGLEQMGLGDSCRPSGDFSEMFDTSEAELPDGEPPWLGLRGGVDVDNVPGCSVQAAIGIVSIADSSIYTADE